MWHELMCNYFSTKSSHPLSPLVQFGTTVNTIPTTLKHYRWNYVKHDWKKSATGRCTLISFIYSFLVISSIFEKHESGFRVNSAVLCSAMEVVDLRTVECLPCQTRFRLHRDYNLCRAVRHLRRRHAELMPEYRQAINSANESYAGNALTE